MWIFSWWRCMANKYKEKYLKEVEKTARLMAHIKKYELILGDCMEMIEKLEGLKAEK